MKNLIIMVLQKLLRMLAGALMLCCIPLAILSCILDYLATKIGQGRLRARRVGGDRTDKIELNKRNRTKPVRCPACRGRGHPNNRWGRTCSLCENRGVLIRSHQALT